MDTMYESLTTPIGLSCLCGSTAADPTTAITYCVQSLTRQPLELCVSDTKTNQIFMFAPLINSVSGPNALV